MIIARLLAGICVLFLGRRLFWLFVGAVGFVLGLDVAAQLFRGMPHTEVLIIALVGGMVGAVLALALEELMVGIAGFAAGAYIAAQILITAMPYPGRTVWIAMLVGGIVGAWLFVGLFDWALIALSSLIGAAFIVQAVPAATHVNYIVFAALVVAGVLVQARLLDREKL